MSAITQLPQKLKAARLLFLLCGLIISSWAPMVPYVKNNLSLNESELGILFLALGIGALLTMPISGKLIKHFGCKPIIIIGAIFSILILPFLVYIDTYLWMCVALFAFGSSIGLLDVGMNTHGLTVQKAWGKQVVSSMHGLYSMGGIFGALVFSLLLKITSDVVLSAAIIALLLIGFALTQYRWILTLKEEQLINSDPQAPADSQAKSRVFSWGILLLGIMCFSAFISEGAMLDWSSVYLNEFKGLSKEWASIGFVVFSVAMTCMRMLGDGLVSRFSPTTVVVTGSLIACLGIAMVLISPWASLALVGFALLGLGAANTVPILFNEAAKTPGMSPAAAIAAVSTMGYSGQLIGPVFLGFIGHSYSLAHAFGVVGLLFVAVALLYPLRKV